MADDSLPVPSKTWSNSLKTAAIVFGVNVLLTGFKFIVYWMSDSLAVLAEAWHSFTDIATSGLIFLAILVSNRKRRKTTASKEDPAEMRAVGNLEIAASVCVGLLLLAVSGLLFKKLIDSQVIAIRNPLLSGLVFVVFSIGAYLVSTFETQVGKSQASLGLLSDGMHAKADMFASLLTGLSLILYAMGVNVDKWMAGTIAAIILCLALDTFVNAYRVYRDKNGNSLYAYRFLAAFFSIFSIYNLKRLLQCFHRLLVTFLGDSRNATRLCKTLLVMPFVVLLLFYGSTAFYTVSFNETVIIERFGRPLKGNPIPPGLHVKLPWPMDSAIKVKTATIEQLNIGNVSASNTQAYIWTRKHGSEEAFLAGDNNFFYPYIILHYRIDDPFEYLYNNANPRQLLNEIGHRVAVALFAREPFYDIATTDRGRLQEKMKQDIQAALNRHKTGIELINVNFKDIHPPILIAKAFENVIAGFQKKQELINQALGYANNVLPDARGKAEKRIQSAAGESVMRLSNAEGNAKRFELRLPETEAQKRLSMLRIYHETMKDTLKDKTKIIVDPDVGTPDIWMNFKNETTVFGSPQTKSDRMGDRRMDEERKRYEER